MFIPGIDQDVEMDPQNPSSAGAVRLDTFFESADYGLPPEASDDFTMQLPMGKVTKVSRQRMKACTTSEQLRELDRSLYREAGLDPAHYGL